MFKSLLTQEQMTEIINYYWDLENEDSSSNLLINNKLLEYADTFIKKLKINMLEYNETSISKIYNNITWKKDNPGEQLTSTLFPRKYKNNELYPTVLCDKKFEQFHENIEMYAHNKNML